MRIDLNSDLGEGFGPWDMGDDAQILSIVTSANIACGGHAGDPETMFRTLSLAHDKGVSVGAHPGYADPIGFGRRVIPMSLDEITRMCAAQIGALQGVAALVGVPVAYVKPHGALATLPQGIVPWPMPSWLPFTGSTDMAVLRSPAPRPNTRPVRQA
ncbi:LamB/YcsF [Roseobacter sp. AzwK-3b]|uniref:5-oxoprolinase subunit PxpA n=1 Tax=Roseobacter sp. AzwK-3b TaxID=351016 RepID=UPI0001569585|nr:5-oxoprolinase subunit PxpA [Roseobacter sp. AzwK-3b]EDM72992.1 LamB/YcsF [Roseobacter sp. AzwK-3b]